MTTKYKVTKLKDGTQVMEHRLIPEGYVVHHIDGNGIEREHLMLHKGNHKKVNGEWLKVCPDCKRLLPMSDYGKHTYYIQWRCKSCHRKYNREYYHRKKRTELKKVEKVEK